MKPFAALRVTLACAFFVFLAASDLAHAQNALETRRENAAARRTNAAPPLQSPQINPDHTVTFRLRAPSAKDAKVAGEWPNGTKEMLKDDLGVWSVTIGPLAPEIYGYGFLLDSVRISDPSNPRLKPMRSPTTSILEIPGDPPLIHEFQNVPHGVVHLHDYQSKSLGVLRRLRVYTPPGYDQSRARYPILYLFHGSGDNEATWTELGRANYILDNLIAAGKAKPMIVVMSDGHASFPAPGSAPTNTLSRNVIDFSRDLLTDVIPLVEQSYRVKKDRTDHAVIGLSMGGGQSLYVGLNNLDKFAWVGGMSSSVANGSAIAAGALADPKANQKLKLLWIGIGKDDFLLSANQEFDELLKKHDLKHEFVVTEGNHSWPVWRRYLAQFAPLLFKN